METGRGVPAKVGLILVSVGLSMLFAEVAVRIATPSYNPARQIVFRVNEQGIPLGPAGETVRQRTPKGDYDLQVAFNPFGLRDEKDLTSCTASDLVVVGDSFGMGWGVEETNRFSDVLAGLTSRRVFNLCVPTDIMGYKRLLRYAESRGAVISNVIVAVCMENDLHDYAAKERAGDGPKSGPAADSMPRRARAWAKSHSALYLLLSYELQRHEAIRNWLERIGIARRYDSDELMHKNAVSDKVIVESARVLGGILDLYSDGVVLIIPSRALWCGNNRENERIVHDKFVGLLESNAVRVVDMKPVFEAARDPMQFYFRTDPHWNEEGHRAAAVELVRFVGVDRDEAGAIQ